MQGGGFHVDMPPYLVSAEGTALISPEQLESTLDSGYTLRPFMNGWSRIITDDGESNFIEIFHSPADMAGLQQLAEEAGRQGLEYALHGKP